MLSYLLGVDQTPKGRRHGQCAMCMGNVDPYVMPPRGGGCSQAAPIALEGFPDDSLNLANAQSYELISAAALDWACRGVSLAMGAVWPMCMFARSWTQLQIDRCAQL